MTFTEPFLYPCVWKFVKTFTFGNLSCYHFSLSGDGGGREYDGNVGLCWALRSLTNSENMIRIFENYDEKYMITKFG